MCAQKRIVIALYGKSCSGKSTTAQKLCELLNCAVHSASGSVRGRSRELGISPNELSLAEHQKIDKDTRHLVQSSLGPLVVEGSFLDALLGDLPRIYRVELTCKNEERRRRYAQRIGQDELGRRDKEDDNLRDSLHGNYTAKADFVVDTTCKTPVQVAEEIVAWLSTKELREQN